MSLTLTTQLLTELWPVLHALDTKEPAPTAKGGYVLGKAADQAQPATARYEREHMKLLTRCATVDDAGVPMVVQEGTQVQFTLRGDAKEEYTREAAALLEEPVTLVGVRMLTNAELGACELTVKQRRVLIAAGLLADEEPV